MDQGDIRPVQGTVFAGGHAGGDGTRPRAQGARPKPPRQSLDQVHLTAPRLATLRLLRERVLENTRLHLDLPRSPGGPHFIVREVERADLFVGLLLSDQNLLASHRGSTWPPHQIRNAMEQGMTQGLAETLEILHELDELDETSWNLVCDVLSAYHRKVDSASTSTDQSDH